MQVQGDNRYHELEDPEDPQGQGQVDRGAVVCEVALAVFRKGVKGAILGSTLLMSYGAYSDDWRLYFVGLGGVALFAIPYCLVCREEDN